MQRDTEVLRDHEACIVIVYDGIIVVTREWRIVLATASMALAMSAPTFRGQLIVGIYVVHIGTQIKVETCLVGSTDWTPATLIITVSELVHLLDSVEQQAALVEQLLTNVYLLAQAASLTVVLS